MDEAALCWLQLQRSIKLPSAHWRALMLLFRHPDELISASRAELEARLPVTLDAQASRLLDDRLRREFAQRLANRAQRESLRDVLTSAECSLLSLGDSEYPALLREIHDPPLLLYLRGRRELLSKAMLAMVGSRRASRRGEQDAQAFARALADSGFTIVSGLALGIDAAAHCGALDADASTVAILGCGVDVCYPRRNADLYGAIAENGLLLSEYPPGAEPLRHQFPRRNRIISGLSLGVLVVEATTRSGSLITARQALEQNREVFALPGSIHSPASRGCNALIREGAKLVETLEDILSELPPQPGGIQGRAPVDNEASGAPPPLYALLDDAPQSLEQLAQRSSLTVAALLSALSELELDGWAEQAHGGWQRCR
ncbi:MULTISPECIES: DNA-processing protein DprA [Spongiibacter]|uniref:DNA-processing protein DprA n=1 Tax=Spongiibacter TaxID=630749 RepID=UPI000C38EA74|nr:MULTISPECIES: DNA-processing protein DprA [Spongiibacter]MAY39830.1 DNA-protecting protein DprA [Spongiibacter sp.]